MNKLVMTLAFVLAVMAGSSLFAQGYVAYMPVGPAPVAAFYAPAPVVGYGPVVGTSYYAPAPYYAAPAPYYAASPVVAPYYVASPVAVAPGVAPPVAVAPVYGRAVIVRPKVYVVGQPVRNVLRAVTP
jgi:hypothetical protein